jgi:hypothetical protein
MPRARFVVLLALAVILYAAASHAGSLSLTNVCTGYTISKRGNDVLVRCPGMRDPWLTMVNCRNPTVQRAGGNITINCGG